MSLIKRYSHLNLSSEIENELKAIDIATSSSNARQALLGKRVPFTAQSIGISTTVESRTDYHYGKKYSEEILETSDTLLFPKERLILKIAKDPTN